MYEVPRNEQSAGEGDESVQEKLDSTPWAESFEMDEWNHGEVY